MAGQARHREAAFDQRRLGQERPLATNMTEEGRHQNRRVEFHIVDGPGGEKDAVTRRRHFTHVGGASGSGARSAWVAPAHASSVRYQVDQHGDFVLLGNTLGYDCGPGVPAPVVGTVGACGTNTSDTAPDVFWRAADSVSAAADTTTTTRSRGSTAILILPTGAVVTYARCTGARSWPGSARHHALRGPGRH